MDVNYNKKFDKQLSEFYGLIDNGRLKFSGYLESYVNIKLDKKLVAVIFPDYTTGKTCGLLNKDIYEDFKEDFLEDLSDMIYSVIKGQDDNLYHINIIKKVFKNFLYENDNNNSAYIVNGEIYKSLKYKEFFAESISVTSEIYEGLIIEYDDRFELLNKSNSTIIMELKKLRDK